VGVLGGGAGEKKGGFFFNTLDNRIANDKDDLHTIL